MYFHGILTDTFNKKKKTEIHNLNIYFQNQTKMNFATIEAKTIQYIHLTASCKAKSTVSFIKFRYRNIKKNLVFHLHVIDEEIQKYAMIKCIIAFTNLLLLFNAFDDT